MGETKSVESACMAFALCERGGLFLMCHLGVMRERKESVLGLMEEGQSGHLYKKVKIAG